MLRQIGNILAVAIFVSLLTSNISTAKTSAWHSAQNQIEATSLPTTAKTAMLTATKARFTGTNAKTSGKTSSGISKQQRQQLIVRYTDAAVTKAHVNQLPAAQQAKVRAQLTATVTQKVNQAVDHDNRVIRQTSNHIQTHTKSLITQAFLSLYRGALPAAVLFIAVSWFFYRRRDYLKRIQHLA